MLITQSAKAGRVAERATALEINPINGLGSRVKDQSKFILTFALCLFRPLARGDVLNRATEPGDLPVDIAQRFGTGNHPFRGGPGAGYFQIKFV